MRDTSALSIAVIALLIFALLAPIGCSSDNKKAVVINQPQQTDASTDSGINIPAPGIILRNVAALSQTRYNAGADFNQSLPNVNVAAQDSAGLFSPNWQSGDPSENLAYAIYSFNVFDFIGAAKLHYVFDSDDNWSNIWLGLPDIAADIWRWQRLDGQSPLDLVEFTNKADEFGNLIVAVVLTGDTPTQLEWLRIGEDIIPQADLQANPTVGDMPLVVNFDASGSVDADGPLVLFEWDWNGDGLYEEDSGAIPTMQHTFFDYGGFESTVRVTNGVNNQATASLPIIVLGDEPRWHISLVADVPFATHTLTNLGGKPAIAYRSDIDDGKIFFIRSLDEFGLLWDDPFEIGNGRLMEGQFLMADGIPALAFIMKEGMEFYSTIQFARALDDEGLAWGAPIDLATEIGNSNFAATLIGGNPAVCYSSPSSGDGLYFLRATDAAGTTWAEPVLAVAPNFMSDGLFSMAEVNGNPAIAFWDDGEYLGYVRATSAIGSSWGTPLTRMSDEWLWFGLTLLVVDGNPAICYADDGIANMYTRSTDVNGAAWGTPVVVDASGDVWNECVMAIVNGVPAISFTGGEFPNTQIYYSESDDAVGTTWTRNEPVSPLETEDWESSLIDLNGMPALTFFTDQPGLDPNQIFFAAYY